MSTKTDEETTGDVIAALGLSPDVHETDIVISTQGCLVRLIGTVGTLEESNEAERITSEIAGVTGVQNDLTVSANREVSDLEMTGCANAELSGYPDLVGVGARVTAGTAFLKGKVRSLAIENRAIEIVSGVPGLRRVVSEIEIAAGEPVDDIGLANDVAEAISNDPNISMTDMEVSVEEGLVVIEGEVETEREFDLITKRASAVPGVQHVKNLVQVRTRVS